LYLHIKDEKMPKKLFKKRRWRAKAKSDHNGKRGLSFSSKIVSTDGVICLVLGIICLIMLIAAVVISTLAKGAADIYVGTIGVIGFVISLTCFIISLKTMNDEYIAETIPKIAVGINFLALLIYLGLYAYGLFIGMV